jgi:NADPH:quinone reductase-like Zn-dependent oxidoreductase
MVRPAGVGKDGLTSAALGKGPTPSMRTLRFHRYGEPADVLQLEDAPVPAPAPSRVRVAVHACGLNPADWALCRGLFQGDLPCGVGLEVSGTVDAVGEGVSDVAVGDRVAGSADYAGYPSAGASAVRPSSRSCSAGLVSPPTSIWSRPRPCRWRSRPPTGTSRFSV